MPNFLEQLVAEWYEFQGFFVRRNVRVGKLTRGGHEGELDVVAFHPVEQRLIHIETSMDSTSWKDREVNFSRKFKVGQKHIRELFQGFEPLPDIEPIALIGLGSARNHATVGGGKVVTVGDFIREIRNKIPHDVSSNVVPEQYVILRTLQFAAESWAAGRERAPAV